MEMQNFKPTVESLGRSGKRVGARGGGLGLGPVLGMGRGCVERGNPGALGWEGRREWPR